MIEGTTLPDAVGPAMQCISDKIDPRSRLFKDFYALLCSNETLLPQIFPASVAIFERLQSDQELLEDIAQFWAGARLGVARVREGLKKISASSAFSISTVSPRDLAIHRFMFASQLIHAVGYKGWVLLLDEVELVGRYSVLQRARSYSMLAWLQGLSGAPTPFRATVAAITDDFALRVLDEKGDEETLGERLVEKGGPWADLSADAQAGMKALREKTLRILKPSAADLYDTGLALRATYAAGYGWTPPEIATDIRVDPTRSRRYYTRRWIGEWDLARLYPDRKIDVSGTTFEYRYDEDRVLDGSEEE